jgi:Polyketide cyclase / dehydrase and lipid transport
MNVVVMAIVAAVVVGLIGLWVAASRRPDVFRVERSAVIAAPAATLHGLVDDFRRWVDWSPWEGRDPAMARQYDGAPRGVGARYAWQGNRQVGRGAMAIVASEPARRIELKLDFLAPFEAHNMAEFTFEPVEGGTRVVWSMHGPANFMSKLMGMVFDMDRMVGRDFEHGLRRLGEAAARAPG